MLIIFIITIIRPISMVERENISIMLINIRIILNEPLPNDIFLQFLIESTS